MVYKILKEFGSAGKEHATPSACIARLVRERFGARYVACFSDEQFRAFNERLEAEPGVQTILISEDWNVYDLGAPLP